jgi:ABC-2 type transport system ATP-binding protein/sodium transport system ATP-binding protein
MIDVRDLTKVFATPHGDWLKAVDRVSFTVAPGEVFGLLGPNGAGKTTTLRMLLGLIRPTSGSATVAGFAAERDPAEVKRRVGLVSANTGVYPWLTARETLAYFADLYAVPPALARQRIAEFADAFGLGDFLDRRCGVLSTGQKQRLNLARALIHAPTALLLDEPTLGLDILGRRIVEEFLELVQARQLAVVLCTHHLEEAERLCHRFGLLNRGRIVRQGSLEQLRAETGLHSLHAMFLDLVGARRQLPVTSLKSAAPPAPLT